ncbi:MAG TPA: glycosyltransferase family 2 protein [Candidatus Udaeobacter sp.]|nr:glycosyltransferase family 2 protein [Candidatus Udaeobacter sp.]
MKLSIIIPAYNEKNTILEILKKVDEVIFDNCDKEVVIVDDCSTDGTREILRGLGDKYKVIFKEKNSGKGASVKLGIAQATGDYITIQDADLEYDPQDLKAMLAPIQAGTADISLGSRTLSDELKNSHTGWSHPHPLTYLGNKLIIASINLLYARKGTDFFACYKIIPRKYMVDLPIEANGFAYDVELLCKLFRKSLKVVEVPIHYNPRTFAEGKKIRYRDGLYVLWTILKWRFKSF